MAAYDLEEQEQLSAIKAWWEKNGNIVTGAALALALVVAGVQGWRWYQGKQMAEAGGLYSAMSQAAMEQNASKVGVLADELLAKHGGSVSAELAALQAAQLALEAGDAKTARTRLEFAVASKADPLLREMARLRLAALQFDSKELDAALETLKTAPAEAFNARFDDLRGDILFAQGKRDEARAAYKAGVEAASKEGQQASNFRSMLQTKLDALGGA
jgi:predicted negative regulator of RcsB-dependent stress response